MRCTKQSFHHAQRRSEKLRVRSLLTNAEQLRRELEKRR